MLSLITHLIYIIALCSFIKCNYQGQTFALADDTPLFKLPFLVKSLQIPEGIMLTLYNNSYYDGQANTYSDNHSCISSGLSIGSRYLYNDLQSRNIFFDNYALNFLGTNILQSGYSEQLTNMTHEIFFKTTNPNGGLFQIFVKTQTTTYADNDRHIYLQNGQLVARIFNDEVITTSGLNLADGKWHQVVHVFGDQFGQKLYVDGQLAASGSRGKSEFFWNNFLEIGRSNDYKTSNFIGSIAEVRIWKKALSASEILQFMTQSPEDRINDLKLWWRMDQFSNQQILDITGQFLGLTVA